MAAAGSIRGADVHDCAEPGRGIAPAGGSDTYCSWNNVTAEPPNVGNTARPSIANVEVSTGPVRGESQW